MLPNYDNSAASLAAKMRITSDLSAAPVNLNIEITDLFAQRVAVEAEQIGGADLIAPCRRQCRRQQRHFDFLEDSVVEPRRRHAVGEAGKMRGQVGFEGAPEIV